MRIIDWSSDVCSSDLPVFVASDLSGFRTAPTRGAAMRRTEVLQEVRQMRFEEINERYRRGRLSALEAAEWLGCSERTFRRLRVRYEAEGAAGLLDRRLGKTSPHRIAADEVERVAARTEEHTSGGQGEA